MLLRVIAASALTLSLSSGAFAGSRHSVARHVSCSEVRYYVAKYSAATAEMYARSHGATDAQIEAARRCLNDQPMQTAQRNRWYTE